MGKCSDINNARKPDPIANNINICTEYIQSADKPYDPNNLYLNTLPIPGSNNNVGDVNNPIPSGFIVPEDLCIPFLPGKKFDDIAEDFCNQIGDVDENGVPEWTSFTARGGNFLKGAAYVFHGKPTFSGSDNLTDLGLDNVKSTCHYNDCDEKTSVNTSWGCCKFCCVIAGTRIACKRQAYAADPVVCCFLDNDCASQNNNIDACFQTPSQRKTCPLEYRNLKSQTCLDVIKPYCTGDKLFAGQSNWMEMWLPDSQVDVNSGQDGNATVVSADGSNQRYMKQPCLRALARAVYNDSGGVCTWEQFTNLDSFEGVVDAAGKAWADDVLESILNRYIKEFGSPIGSINQDGYLQSTSFLDFYWNLCKTFPAICQRSLSNFCSRIKVKDLLDRPEAIKWCGCHMTDDQYSEYEQFSITRECTPYCNIKGNIPTTDEADYTTKVCTQTTCIIDDVSIKLAEIQNPGGFNFNQLCNSCGGSQISKIFTGANSNIVKDSGGLLPQIEGGPNTFSQFIPDNVSGIKFWYTNVPSDANVDSDGYMMVQLTNCTYIDQLTQTFSPISGKENPVVTLNYTSVSIENYQNLGKGTLYYITGIKDIIAAGDITPKNNLSIKKDKNYGGINKYLTKSFTPIEPFPMKSGSIPDNSTNFKELSLLDGSNNLYSPNFDFTVSDWPKVYNNNVSNNYVSNGQPKSEIWNCWSHYSLVFQSKLNITDYNHITNNIREDNIQIEANACSCIIRDSTIDLEDSRIRSLNVNQNCGASQCYNSSNQTIPCGSNTTSGNVINDVTNTINDFEKELLTNKKELATIILGIVLVILILVWISVQHRYKKK